MNTNRPLHAISLWILLLACTAVDVVALDPTWVSEPLSVIPSRLIVSDGRIIAIEPGDGIRKSDSVTVLSSASGAILWEATELPSRTGSVAVDDAAVYAAGTARFELTTGARRNGPDIGRIERFETVPECGLVSVRVDSSGQTLILQDRETLGVIASAEFDRIRDLIALGWESTILVRSSEVGKEHSVLRALSCSGLETRWERRLSGAHLATPYGVIVREDGQFTALDWIAGSPLWNEAASAGRLQLVDDSRFAVIGSETVELRSLSSGALVSRAEIPFAGELHIGGDTLLLLEEPDRYGRHLRMAVIDLSTGTHQVTRRNRSGIVAEVTPEDGRVVSLGPGGDRLEIVSVETGLGIERLRLPEGVEVLELTAQSGSTVFAALSGGRVARFDLDRATISEWAPAWIRNLRGLPLPIGVETDSLIAVDTERDLLYGLDSRTGATTSQRETASSLSDRVPFVHGSGLVAGLALSASSRIQVVAYNTEDLSYAGSTIVLGWPEFSPVVVGRRIAYVSGRLSQELRLYDLDTERERDYGTAYEVKTSESLLAATMRRFGSSLQLHLFAIEESGDLDWLESYRLRPEAFTVHGSRAAFVEEGRLVLANPRAEEESSFDLTIDGRARQILLDDDAIALVQTTAGLEAIDTASGVSLWHREHADDEISSIARSEGVVLVASESGDLLALAISNGSTLAGVGLGDEDAHLAVGAGHVFVGTGGRLIALPLPDPE